MNSPNSTPDFDAMDDSGAVTPDREDATDQGSLPNQSDRLQDRIPGDKTGDPTPLLFCALALVFNLIALYNQMRGDFLAPSRPARIAAAFWALSVILAGISAWLYAAQERVEKKKRKIKAANLYRWLERSQKKIVRNFSKFLKKTARGLARFVRKTPLISLTGVILFAFFVRVTPIRVNGIYLDEWYWIDAARSILSGRIVSPFGFIGDQPSNLPAYIVAFFLKISDDPVLTVRITGVTYSLISMAAVYLLARKLLGKKGALAAALLMSVSVWDIHMSTLGWNNVTPNPMLVSLVLLFLYQLVTDDYSYFTLFILAFLISICLHLLYVAAIMLLPAGLVLIYHWLYQRKPIRKKEIALFLLFGFICASPVIPKLIEHPQDSIGRHFDFFEENVAISKETSLSASYYLRQGLELVKDISVGKDNFHVQGLWGITIQRLDMFLLALSILLIPIQVYRKQSSPFWLVILFTLFILLVVPFVVLYRTTSVWRAYAVLPVLFILITYALVQIARFLTEIARRRFNPKKSLYPYLIGASVLAYLLLSIPWFQQFSTVYLEPEDNYENNICQAAKRAILRNVSRRSTVLMEEELCYPMITAQFDEGQYNFVPINADFTFTDDLSNSYLILLNSFNFGGYHIEAYQSIASQILREREAELITLESTTSPVLYFVR